MQVKVSDCIARNLAKWTDTVFGITGGAITNIFDSLAGTAGLSLITPNHEQGAAMMADAYSRLKAAGGKFGVVVVTSGPGATNMLTGTACSWFDSIPVLIISGQVPVGHLRGSNVRQVGFQETDVVSIFMPVVKNAWQITSVDQVVPVFEAALTEMLSGRKGPVLIDICDDVQRQYMDDTTFNPDYMRILADTVAEDGVVWKMAKVKHLIRESRNPVLVMGSGARLSTSDQMVVALARKWNMPVALTWGALDTMDDADPLNLRDFGVTAQRATNFVLQEADLLICLGTRLDTHEVGVKLSAFATKAKKIVIDIDGAELARLQDYVDITLRMPIYLFVAYAKDFVYDFSEWATRARQLRSLFPICPRNYHHDTDVNPYVFMQFLSDAVAENAVIVTDAGCTVVWTMQGWRVRMGQRLFTAFNNSPMGYALPASIGAYYANPNTQVVCIIGDGSFQMNIQELALLSKTNIKVFVLNNDGYGMIRQTQDTWLAGHHVAVDGPFGDELKVAQAYGIDGQTIGSRSGIQSGVDKALTHPGAFVTSVCIGKEHKIVPKLVFGKSLEYASPELSEQQIQEIRDYLHE